KALGESAVGEAVGERPDGNAFGTLPGRRLATQHRQHQRAIEQRLEHARTRLLREGRELGKKPAKVSVMPGFDAARGQPAADQVDGRLAPGLDRGVARERPAMRSEGVQQKLFGSRSLYLGLDVHGYP